MKKIYLKRLFFIVLIIFSCLALYNCSEEQKAPKPVKDLDTGGAISMKAAPVKGNFQDYRNKTLNTSPTELGISIADEKNKVYGVIMEINIDGVIHTVYSFENGDAGLYIGTGDGIVNASKNPAVMKAAKAFLKSGKNYLEKTEKAKKTPLPEKEIIKFYLLTNKGIYSATEVSINIESNSSPWTTLYDRGSDLLAELLKEKPVKL